MEQTRYCTRCGKGNSPQHRYCVGCGSPLLASIRPQMPSSTVSQRQAGVAEHEMQPQATPSQQRGASVAQDVRPQASHSQQVASVEQGVQFQAASPEPGVSTETSQAYAPPVLVGEGPVDTEPVQPARTPVVRGSTLVVSASVTLVAGLLVLISTWLPWGMGPAGSLTGWGWYNIGRIAVTGGGDFATPFFVYYQGYPVFTGLCSLLLGSLLAIAGLLVLIFANRKTAITTIVISALALLMAVVNLTSILRQPDASLGIGLILFLIFALAGLIGGIVSLRSNTEKKAAPIPATYYPNRAETDGWR